jgi:hypothetical protein
MADNNGNKNLMASDFVNESRLLDWLNVDSKQLASMRARGFPYIQMGNKARMYYLPSVVVWLKDRERQS